MVPSFFNYKSRRVSFENFSIFVFTGSVARDEISLRINCPLEKKSLPYTSPENSSNKAFTSISSCEFPRVFRYLLYDSSAFLMSLSSLNSPMLTTFIISPLNLDQELHVQDPYPVNRKPEAKFSVAVLVLRYAGVL